MMAFQKKSDDKSYDEIVLTRRQFIRLESVFPVEFRAISAETGEEVSDLIQGFTRNVSEGGLCLEVNNLAEHVVIDFTTGKSKLSLTVNMPFLNHPVQATGHVAWIGKARGEHENRYVMGVGYETINAAAKKQIIRFANRIRRAPWILTGIFSFFVIIISVIGFHNFIVRHQNAQLIDKLIDASVDRIKLEDSVEKLNSAKTTLEKQLGATEEKISLLETRLARIEETKEVLLATRSALLTDLAGEENDEMPEMQLGALESDLHQVRTELAQATEEHATIKTQLTEVISGKLSLEAALEETASQEVEMVTDTLHRMYQWIRFYQNPRTGLVRSYEGDDQVAGWSFTYDEALIVQCFLLFDDVDAARRILDFYRTNAEKVNGSFVNAYDAATGSVTEYGAHVGPNVWLGISALQFYQKAPEDPYLELAESIAKWVLEIQRTDPDGGLRGGRDIEWFSTEHNLDAYAFFTMLHEVTGKREYQIAADRVLEWVKKYAYHQEPGRLNRGKGDATIATDTLAWAIAAIGPETLKKNDMDPDTILEFAENHCKVTTNYQRPTGEMIQVTGFDFTKSRNIARGGIISTEWTGQMIVSFRMMEEYYTKLQDVELASFYRERARFYLKELQKLILISPNKAGHPGWALPYATQEDVDTGHGWRTARGASTGSASGTVYGIFARLRYNPLMLHKWDRFDDTKKIAP